MKRCYITFRSVTHAQRGEQLLKSQGIRCHLLRTPKWMESQGCGYSLRIRTGDLHSVSAVMNDNRILFRKIYVQNPDGTLEEALP